MVCQSEKSPTITTIANQLIKLNFFKNRMKRRFTALQDRYKTYLCFEMTKSKYQISYRE